LVKSEHCVLKHIVCLLPAMEPILPPEHTAGQSLEPPIHMFEKVIFGARITPIHGLYQAIYPGFFHSCRTKGYAPQDTPSATECHRDRLFCPLQPIPLARSD